MRPLKKFDEYKKRGVVNKVSPDINRAQSLKQEAEKRRRFLDEIKQKITLDDDNSNYFIENTYDIILELIRSKMLLEGYNATGEGAHEAEVAFSRNLGFDENEARFLNELRYFRNGILYYGKQYDKDYADKVLEFLEKICPKIL